MIAIIDTIKQKLTAKAATEAEQAAAEFNSLVRDLAAGQNSRSIEDVEAVLKRSGKSIEELQADTERLLDRELLLGLLPAEAEARAAIEDASADFEVARTRFEQAERDWKDARDHYGRVGHESQATLRQVAEARQKLIAGCRDKDAFNRWTEETAKVARLETQLSRYLTDLGSGGSGIVGAIPATERDIAMATQSGLMMQAADAQARLVDYRASKVRLEKAIKATEVELAAARKDLAAAEQTVVES